MSSNGTLSLKRKRSRVCCACLISSLILCWFLPAFSVILHISKLSGLEIVPLVLAWIFTQVPPLYKSGHRLYLGIFTISALISFLTVGKNIQSSLFSFSILTTPFFVIYAVSILDMTSRLYFKKFLFKLLFIESLWCIFQIVFVHSDVDRVKGSLLQTGAGGHIASFFLLTSISLIVKSKWSKIYIFLYIILAISVAFLADAKQVIIFFLISWIYILLRIRGKNAFLRFRSLKFIISGSLGILMFLYLVTGFGGIKGYNYIKLTYQTGGGKIAVTKELFNINSDFWNRNSFLFGAGAANTISRSAGMTYPGYNGNAPALKFGVPPAKEWPYFTNLAKGNFYVGDSSATSPVSSLLGVLGDYGIFGLVSFIYSYYGRISRNNFDSSNSRKSFIGFSLLFIFVLSYINDWLELTVASITFFAILGLLFTEEAEDEM